MAVSFVMGRSGSGKTHRCFNNIVTALKANPRGPRIFWLLPRQATFSAERALTCDSGLGGFIRAQVLSFEQLGHEIIQHCGGASIPEITPLGRQMILGHLLRRHASSLKFFRKVARQPGLAARLDGTFTEFERCGKDAADLQALMTEMSTAGTSASPALLDKIHDLHLIYTAYTAYLGQDRLDQHRRLLHVLESLGGCTIFKDALIYVDGFLEFTDYERQILAGLGQVCHVEIAVMMDPASPVLWRLEKAPDALSLFHPVEISYRRLRAVFREKSVPVDEPVTVLKATHRFKTPALRTIEKHAFGNNGAATQDSTDGVELLEAATRTAEVDAAARRILKFLEAGLRLRDIAVVVRDLGDYQELINASFAEHGIRHFLDRRRPTSHHPLVHFVRAVLAIAQQNWPHEGLMALLKTGLTGISDSDADALENYVLKHRIRGEQWTADNGPEGPSADDSTDDLRQQLTDPLIAFIQATRGGAPVRAIVAALFVLIESFPVRRTLEEWIRAAEARGDFEEKHGHVQIWSDLCDVFDQMVELLGDEIVTLAGFNDILDAGLDQFDLGLTPPTVDEVIVGQVDRTRLPPARAVLVLGMAEGCFPRVPREDSVLSDTDRRTLQDRGVEVLPASDRRLLDEQLLAYIAFTGASETLYLSRPLANAKGNPLSPSIFWSQVRRLFPTLSPQVISRENQGAASLISTSRQLLTGLLRWVRNSAASALTGGSSADGCHSGNENPPVRASAALTWPSLYQWLAEHPDEDGHLRRAWHSLTHTNHAALPADIAHTLFPSPLHAGVRELEAAAACPFQHFLRHGIRLRPRDDAADVSGLDLGHVYHQALEDVTLDMLRRHKNWPELTEALQKKLLSESIERIGRELRGQIMLSSARSRYLLGRIERNLKQVIATQRTAAGRGHFKTTFTTTRFGKDGPLPELIVPTPKDHELRLAGKIDRIDLVDGQAASVVDYRLGEHALPLAEVYHGLSLQLLTYLLVLESGGEALTGRKLTPAAAFYVRLLRKIVDVAHPSDALLPDDPAFHLAIKPRGLLDERFLDRIDSLLVTGRSQVVNATRKKDGTHGAKNSSDLADEAEIKALLDHVSTLLGRLADQVMSGHIAVAPYMYGTTTPCPNCEFRSVCRFEPRDRYHMLEGMSRVDVLERVTRGEAGADVR